MKKNVLLLLAILGFVKLNAQVYTISHLKMEMTDPNYDWVYLCKHNAIVSFGGFMYNKVSNKFGDGEDFCIYSQPGYDLNLYSSSSKIILGADGTNKVGIGTTSPDAKLDIYEAYFKGIKFWTTKNINYDANNTSYETIGSRSGVLQFWHPIISQGEELGGGWTQIRCGGMYEIGGLNDRKVISELSLGNLILYDATSSSSYYSDIKTVEIQNDGDAFFEGKVTAEEIEVKADVWADDVFETEYDLNSIKEVEEYIQQNNHLPDVPSEKEVMENGINLGDMDAVLLRKIEELTLYVIDLKKENEELREMIMNK